MTSYFQEMCQNVISNNNNNKYHHFHCLNYAPTHIILNYLGTELVWDELERTLVLLPLSCCTTLDSTCRLVQIWFSLKGHLFQPADRHRPLSAHAFRWQPKQTNRLQLPAWRELRRREGRLLSRQLKTSGSHIKNNTVHGSTVNYSP